MPDARDVLDGVLADLAAEGAELDALVAPLSDSDWQRPTPAEGWTIAHQIGHLAWTDEVAHIAVTDPQRFAALLREAAEELGAHVDRAAEQQASRPSAQLLDRWRAGRTALTEALTTVPSGQKLPWFGPPMSATSMGTARLMETWAHGQDVADALGATRVPTDRLKHVAHIGVRTRDFAYLVHDRTPPAAAFRIELVGPSGALWAWGPDDATQHIAGPALDFCLLVTQRRHRDDLALVASGADADEWLDIAQAFAGPPGSGRAAGRFTGAGTSA